MKDYEVKDYGSFNTAVGTIKAYQTKVNEAKTSAGEVKTILSNEAVFMGPVAENCVQTLTTVDSDISTIDANFTTLMNYITSTETNYKTGDQQASAQVTSLDGSVQTSQAGVTAGTNAKGTVEIPDSVQQSGYTVTCYGEGGWYLGGGDKATSVASGTKQKSVHEKWLADGARYKNGIAVINVNGQDHYLIATAPTLGNVGDNVNVTLKNGQNVPCVIADAKSTHDSNYTTYGHGRSNGSVNVLEFEVDRHVYREKGNPTTSKWGLEWDSSSGVKSVTNYGSIV